MIICGALLLCAPAMAQTDLRMKQPDLHTTEFFDPTAKKKAEPYKFSTDWRVEAGYVQWDERVLDTTTVYQHGMRLGATVDLNLPHNFKQTQADSTGNRQRDSTIGSGTRRAVFTPRTGWPRRPGGTEAGCRAPRPA